MRRAWLGKTIAITESSVTRTSVEPRPSEEVASDMVRGTRENQVMEGKGRIQGKVSKGGRVREVEVCLKKAGRSFGGR